MHKGKIATERVEDTSPMPQTYAGDALSLYNRLLPPPV